MSKKISTIQIEHIENVLKLHFLDCVQKLFHEHVHPLIDKRKMKCLINKTNMK